MAKTTKANSPAPASRSAVSIATGVSIRINPRRGEDRHRLHRDQRRDCGKVGQRIRKERHHVDAHADGHEEQAEEQPLERLDIDLELVAVFALAEEQPGEEGAERRGEPGRGGQHGGADRQEERNGDDEVAVSGAGRDPEQRTGQVPSGEEDAGDRGNRDGDRLEHRPGGGDFAAAEQFHDDDDRHHHQVLEEEHAERDLPDRTGEAADVEEDLGDDRRRGQGERQADHQGKRRLGAERQSARHDRQRRRDDLDRADAEHIAAHRPQPVEGEFEADHEEQEHHAKLGERPDPLGIGEGDPAEPRQIADEMTEASGAERDACDQEPGNHAQAKPAEERHDDARGREEYEKLPPPPVVKHGESRVRRDPNAGGACLSGL